MKNITPPLYARGVISYEDAMNLWGQGYTQSDTVFMLHEKQEAKFEGEFQVPILDI